MATNPLNVDALVATFGRLGQDMELRGSRLMVAAAGGVVRKEARAIAQTAGLRRTGALIKNIVIKREKTPKGVTQYNLGVRHGRHLGRAAKKTLAVAASGRIVTRYENDPWYWAILHGGAKPHEIRARKGGALSFGGRTVQVVMHPGIKAVPFISLALERKQYDALEAMKARLETVLQKAGK